MRHWHEAKSKRSIALFAFFVFLILLGCSSDHENKRILYDPAQMNTPSYSIGVPQGAAAMTVVEQKFPRCKIKYFANLNDGYLAVQQGKIDAFAFDRHTLRYVAAKNHDLALMEEKIANESIVIASALERKDLIEKVNAFIRRYRADGTYQDMYNRWLLGTNTKMPDLPEPENPTMTLIIGTEGLDEPMDFYANGQLTGFDVEFVKRLALFLNAKVTYRTMEFSSLVIAAQTGKIDLLAANLNVTGERREKILFSDTYVDSEISFLVRKDRLPPKNTGVITDLSQLAQKKVGIITGSAYESVLKSQIPGAVPEYFNNFSDQAAAVKAGKIAGFLVDEPIARDIMNNTSGMTTLKKTLTSDGYAFAFSRSHPELQKQVNAALKEMQDDGTLKKIDARWFGRDEAAKVLPDLQPEGRDGVIRFATNSNMAPFAYIKQGKMVGYDIEIAIRIAAKLGRTLEIVDMDVAAIIPSLISGKSDMTGGGITITKERAQSVLFSIPNYTGGIAVMVAANADTRENEQRILSGPDQMNAPGYSSGVPQSAAVTTAEEKFPVRKDRLSPKASDAITDFSQFAGKKVGVQTGTTYETVLKTKIPEAVPMYFTNFADQIEAVKSGKISGFLADEVGARDIIRHTSGITYLSKWLCANEYAFAFSPNQTQLHRQVNAVMQEIRNDGTLKKLEAKWFGTDDKVKVLPERQPAGTKGVIRFATNSDSAPFVYMKNGNLVGYDIEVAMIIAGKLGRKLEIMDMDFSAIIPSLVAGKSDMAGAFIAVTKERAKSVLFSIPNYAGGTVVVVAVGVDARQSVGKDSFWSGLIKSFKRTFVVEDRYKLVLQGLWVTIVISILSAIFGTLLGFGVCMMRRAKTRWANIPAKVFIRAIQGTPIVVLLMILYYIVFGSVDINAILVAVVGFSVNFAAYVSEMMRTGIDAVDKGQHEAAYAIGFNKIQVFSRITFPQAARHILPVFKGEFISMLKMTSVVGYIAIQDLTKMSDIIRSRTYEAFFPLIATALIYFVIAYFMAYLLSLVEMRVDPKQRKRVVKGVVRP